MSLGLLGAGLTGLAGGLLTKEALDRLQGVGAQAKQEAFDLAAQIQPMTQFRPFTVTSATGGQFGVTGGEDGTAVTMSLSDQEEALQNRLFGGAGQFFGQAMQDTAGREQDIYQRIRAAQSPEEQRQRLALEERLAQQGRLGVRTGMFGGTPEAFAMEKAQAEAQNQAMLMAMQQAQQEQAQQAALGQQFLGGAYVPQAQMLNVQQASQLYPQLQQQAQLFGAGQFGETMMTGIEAQLLAEQAQANLYGQIGSGLLSGLFTPVAQQGGGATNVLTSILQSISDVRLKENIEKVGTVEGINLYVWDWNEEGKKIAGNQKAFGVLAQEIAKDRPSAVIEGSDGYLRVNYGELPEVADLVLFGEE